MTFFCFSTFALFVIPNLVLVNSSPFAVAGFMPLLFLNSPKAAVMILLVFMILNLICLTWFYLFINCLFLWYKKTLLANLPKGFILHINITFGYQQTDLCAQNTTVDICFNLLVILLFIFSLFWILFFGYISKKPPNCLGGFCYIFNLILNKKLSYRTPADTLR